MNQAFIATFFEVNQWDLYILENASGAKTGYIRYPHTLTYNLGEIVPDLTQFDRNFMEVKQRNSNYNVLVDIYFSTHWYKDNVDARMNNFADKFFPVNANQTLKAVENMGWTWPTITDRIRVNSPLWHEAYLGGTKPWPLYKHDIPQNDGILIGSTSFNGKNGIYPALTAAAFNGTAGNSVNTETANNWVIGYSTGVMSFYDNPDKFFPQGITDANKKKIFVPKTGVPYTTARDGYLIVLWITEV